MKSLPGLAAEATESLSSRSRSTSYVRRPAAVARGGAKLMVMRRDAGERVTLWNMPVSACKDQGRVTEGERAREGKGG